MSEQRQRNKETMIAEDPTKAADPSQDRPMLLRPEDLLTKLGQGGGGEVYEFRREDRRLVAKLGNQELWMNLAELVKELSFMTRLRHYVNILKFRGLLRGTDRVGVLLSRACSDWTGFGGQRYLVGSAAVGAAAGASCVLTQPVDSYDKVLLLQQFIGLDALHVNRMFHRDFKGNNILLFVDKDGVPLAQISDFGVSQVMTEEGRPYCNIGTLQYWGGLRLAQRLLSALAGERFPLRRGCGWRDDIVAAGLIMFEKVFQEQVTPFSPITPDQIREAYCHVENITETLVGRPTAKLVDAIATLKGDTEIPWQLAFARINGLTDSAEVVRALQEFKLSDTAIKAIVGTSKSWTLTPNVVQAMREWLPSRPYRLAEQLCEALVLGGHSEASQIDVKSQLTFASKQIKELLDSDSPDIARLLVESVQASDLVKSLLLGIPTAAEAIQHSYFDPALMDERERENTELLRKFFPKMLGWPPYSPPLSTKPWTLHGERELLFRQLETALGVSQQWVSLKSQWTDTEWREAVEAVMGYFATPDRDPELPDTVYQEMISHALTLIYDYSKVAVRGHYAGPIADAAVWITKRLYTDMSPLPLRPSSLAALMEIMEALNGEMYRPSPFQVLQPADPVEQQKLMNAQLEFQNWHGGVCGLLQGIGTECTDLAKLLVARWTRIQAQPKTQFPFSCKATTLSQLQQSVAKVRSSEELTALLAQLAASKATLSAGGSSQARSKEGQQ